MISEIYEGNKENLEWKCLEKNCGEIFNASWTCISQNQGCPYCAGRQVGLSNCLAIKNPKLASEWHPTKNGDLTPYNITTNSNKKIWWKCNKNPKHEWKVSINNRTGGKGCPYCYGRYATDDYNLLVIYPKLCKEWDYKKNEKKPEEYLPRSNQKVWWICKECGHEWKTQIANRNGKTKSGCPQCKNNYKGEIAIKIYLINKNICYESQYNQFKDLVSDLGNPLIFDFAIFKNKEKTKLRFLIEYDGIQHFEWQKTWMTKKKFQTLQYHDKLKDEYCKKNNIKLLRIPYWDFDNIEQILNNINDNINY